METALVIAASAASAVSGIAVIAVFVWAARKDGEHDRAVQKRIGIRRRTRIGL